MEAGRESERGRKVPKKIKIKLFAKPRKLNKNQHDQF